MNVINQDAALLEEVAHLEAAVLEVALLEAAVPEVAVVREVALIEVHLGEVAHQETLKISVYKTINTLIRLKGNKSKIW